MRHFRGCHIDMTLDFWMIPIALTLGWGESIPASFTRGENR
jgi:hypothetical protein